MFCAWLNHTDIKPDNTLDTYVEEGGRQYLRHHLIDFGEALGGLRAESNRLRDGYEHTWDWTRQTQAFFALGLWKRPWEGQKTTRWLSVGAFSADTFDPTYWRPAATYAPFEEMDAADAYWAAKIVARFDRPILEAVVAEGQLSHPKAAKYLVDTLLKRRDKVGRAYLETVTPLDRFEIRNHNVCAVDLGMLHGPRHLRNGRSPRRRRVGASRVHGRRTGPGLHPAAERRRVFHLSIAYGEGTRQAPCLAASRAWRLTTADLWGHPGGVTLERVRLCTFLRWTLQTTRLS